MANKKNDNFITAIKKQSEQQRKILINNIKSKKTDAINKAEIEFSDKARQIINRKISINTTNIKSEYAIKDLKSQGELFKLRDNMVKEIFEDVKTKLISFTETTDYKSYLIKLAKEISQHFENYNSTLYVNSKDFKFKDDITVLFNKDVTIEIDDTITIGGIKGYCKELKQLADNTLDSKLIEEKNNFIKNANLKIV